MSENTEQMATGGEAPVENVGQAAPEASVEMAAEKPQQPAIIIVTHGHLGQELRRSVEMIIGHIDDIYCLSLMEGMDPMDLRLEVKRIVDEQPVEPIILTDLFGGSPSNIAATFVDKGARAVITGLNLPMLIEAVMQRIQGKYDMADALIEVGKEAVVNVGQVMAERRKKC